MKFKLKAKKLGLKTFDVDMGMFNYPIRFVIGDRKKSVELVNWFFEDQFYSDAGEPPYGEFYAKAPYIPIIWLPRNPRTGKERATLAHECCHAMISLFQWAGMPVDLSTNEVFAHGVSHLIEQFSIKVQ